MKNKKKNKKKQTKARPIKKKKKAKKKIQPARQNKTSLKLKGLSMRDVAVVVAAHLRANGHDAVLVGDACAGIYCGLISQVKTIEFSIMRFEPESVYSLMAKLGFYPKDEHKFVNKQLAYAINLLPMPIAIGDDVVEHTSLVNANKGKLKTLTPTDCVRQQLSLFYRWNDKSALEKAVRIAKRHKIDLELVKRWSDWEWAIDKFQHFAEMLED